MTDPIVKTVTVPVSAAKAFDVFVNRAASWWPLGTHAVSASQGKPAQSMRIESKLGGAVYETMHDGTRATWGEVLEFEPDKKIAMTWHPGTNANTPTRVDVVFEEREAGRTTVTLTHSGWEVWGDEAQAKRDGYSTGWDGVLGERYVAAFT